MKMIAIILCLMLSGLNSVAVDAMPTSRPRICASNTICQVEQQEKVTSPTSVPPKCSNDDDNAKRCVSIPPSDEPFDTSRNKCPQRKDVQDCSEQKGEPGDSPTPCRNDESSGKCRSQIYHLKNLFLNGQFLNLAPASGVADYSSAIIIPKSGQQAPEANVGETVRQSRQQQSTGDIGSANENCGSPEQVYDEISKTCRRRCPATEMYDSLADICRKVYQFVPSMAAVPPPIPPANLHD